MNSRQVLERAGLLIAQNRHEDAIGELQRLLAAEPDNARAHAWLGYCIAQDRDRLREAAREVEQAVHLDPDDPLVFYLQAVICEYRNQTGEALTAIERSIQLDPVHADFFGLKAGLLGRLNRWEDALQAAETGLQHHPEDPRCQSVRIHALERLGRVDDAVRQADSAVARAPDSADAHASRGWALLQQGQIRESQAAFREALRLQPNNDFARQGMIQALNNGNPVFRFFYALLIRLSRLGSGVRWALIIGAWVLIQVLDSVAARNPSLQVWVLPLTAFYLLFVMMSWIINPLFNTLLRFHPFGRYLLSRKEIWASSIIAGTLVFGLVTGVVVAVTNGLPALALLPILHAIYLTIPVSVAFETEANWAVLVSIVVAAGFGIVFLINVLLMIVGVGVMPLLIGYTIGIVVYCFAGQALIAARPRY